VSNSGVEIEITQREAKLILEYGYPFQEQEILFEAAAKKKRNSVIQIDSFWLETILGDLCRSMREINSYYLLEQLDALCDSLEWALKAKK
jgi:hypothetical protein